MSGSNIKTYRAGGHREMNISAPGDMQMTPSVETKQTLIEGTPKQEKVQYLRTFMQVAQGIVILFTAIVCFILLAEAMTTDKIPQDVIYTYDTTVLAQTNTSTITPEMGLNFFTTMMMGVQGDPIEVQYDVADPSKPNYQPNNFPRVWQYEQTNTHFTMTKVHSKYLILWAFWIATAFSAVTVRVNPFDRIESSRFRIFYLISAWNILGIILMIYQFLEPSRRWGPIPTSNFIATVTLLFVSWAYQFYFLVQLTDEYQSYMTMKQSAKYVNEFTWVRRVLYLEFATTFPLLLVAGISPSNEGLEQWRVQTILFCTYVFFTILGVYERWDHMVKTQIHEVVMNSDTPVVTLFNVEGDDVYVDGNGDGLGVDKTAIQQNDNVNVTMAMVKNLKSSHERGQFYLLYAMVMALGAIWNSGWRLVYAQRDYLTHSIRLCQAGTLLIIVFMLSVVSLMFAYVCFNYGKDMNKKEKESLEEKKNEVKTIREESVDQKWRSHAGHAEALFFVGSIVVKIIFFLAITDTDMMAIKTTYILHI
jgi:hypothetical protein